MENQLELLCHSSIRIQGNKIVYFDPFEIKKEYHDADYIFCTHSHHDHFSIEDIKKVKKEDTTIITVKSSQEDALSLVKDVNHLVIVEPGNQYKIDDLEFETTYAYNEGKPFHPKDNNWVGFILNLNGTSYYVAGDTDNVKELQDIQCDIALLPIGGKFTMNYEEAAKLANQIDAKIIVPTHYGNIIGTNEDRDRFKDLVKNKEVKIFI